MHWLASDGALVDVSNLVVDLVHHVFSTAAGLGQCRGADRERRGSRGRSLVAVHRDCCALGHLEPGGDR
jgi:hypothetical protein